MTTTRAAIIALLVACALGLTAASVRSDACCVIGEPATWVKPTSTPLDRVYAGLPMIAREWAVGTVSALGDATP